MVSKHLYLIKANDNVISHCRCENALVTFPPQMDCPWCGCGWLFTCIECRKAFMFAKAVAIEEPWEDLAQRDISRGWGRPAEPDDISGWVSAMQGLMRDLREGETYVYLDGFYIPADDRGFRAEGWAAVHDFPQLPHVSALDDQSVIEQTLANRNYWIERRVEREDG